MVSIGLCAALKARGHAVQPFKKGPDYIDPMWLSLAAGRACRNLDLYLMERDDVVATFARHSAEVNLVEGNKGLYDGLALDGSNSNAALAKLLDLPVFLVIDARGMTRGIAPLILGYQAFDRDINIAGVILNNLGGSRHEAKLREVIEHYTDVPVIGAIHHDERLGIVERHLGLMPSNESHVAAARIRQIGEAVAELVPFDALRDARLPEVDALYIGGGFPETCAAELEANSALRAQIRQAIENGMPAYAECGGLMYLSRSIAYQGRTYQMVGAIPGDVRMHDKPIGRGYVHLKEDETHPWPRPAPLSEESPPIQLSPASGRKSERERQSLIRAHEFHYSSLENLPDDMRFAYHVERGYGIDGECDGLVLHNLLASYTHLRTIGSCYWATRFVAFIRRQREQRHSRLTRSNRQAR